MTLEGSLRHAQGLALWQHVASGPQCPQHLLCTSYGSSQWPYDMVLTEYYPQLAEEETEAQGPTLGL